MDLPIRKRVDGAEQSQGQINLYDGMKFFQVYSEGYRSPRVLKHTPLKYHPWEVRNDWNELRTCGDEEYILSRFNDGTYVLPASPQLKGEITGAQTQYVPAYSRAGDPTPSCGPIPVDAAARKNIPIASGVIDYFPDALACVAAVSKAGGEQHNPGKPLFWDRSKSGDESDALMRHFLERGKFDTDGQRHSAKVAWRALALLQKEIEAARGETNAL